MVLMASGQNTTDASDAARPASHAVKWHHIKRHLLRDFYVYFKLAKVVSTEQRNIKHILIYYE